MKPENNLDFLAAKHAQKLVKEVMEGCKNKPKDNDIGKLENSITKTLGVLQENGVYACFLYLYAREKDFGDRIARHILNLLAESAFNFPSQPQEQDKRNHNDILQYISERLTGNLPNLLLAREALERFLIYARYGAKAAQKE